MKIERNEILTSFVAGVFLGIVTIIMFYALYLFGNWLFETSWTYIMFTAAMVIISIDVGAAFVDEEYGPARSLLDIFTYDLTLLALAYYINVTEIYIWTAVLVITAALIKIFPWIKAGKIKNENTISIVSSENK